jgi:ABC-2 type transport system permease protein
MEGQQIAQFALLPSMMLSDFMFPFKGMPEWAQWIGEVLPLTHVLRITRGALLRAMASREIWPELWPIVASPSAAGSWPCIFIAKRSIKAVQHRFWRHRPL